MEWASCVVISSCKSRPSPNFGIMISYSVVFDWRLNGFEQVFGERVAGPYVAHGLERAFATAMFLRTTWRWNVGLRRDFVGVFAIYILLCGPNLSTFHKVDVELMQATSSDFGRESENSIYALFQVILELNKVTPSLAHVFTLVL